MITSRILNDACNILSNGSDAVLGPAEDGGYYLIGLRQADLSVFKDIIWGGLNVADSTRKKMKLLGWQWKELDTLWDVDRPSDYERLNNTKIFQPASSSIT